MKKETKAYQSETISMPTLKSVLGDIPEPDPDETFDPYHAFNKKTTRAEARTVVVKLIKHLEKK